MKKKNQNKFFFVFWLWFSINNNRRTNVRLVGIFENAHKKSYWPSKMALWPFLAVNNGLFVHLKILIKITFVRLLFLKLKQKKNMKKTNVFGFYFKLKNAFFGGQPIFF